MVQCILQQKYPKELMEWIIVDDGTDKIGDLVKDIPFVKYVALEEKMLLGKKRNFMHEQCTFKEDSAIVVYIDDDDYYPPDRVSHAVDKLVHSKSECAGSSELYLWFNDLEKMYKVGPYGPTHATAGTFAFKRSLLKTCSYAEDAVLSEEKYFLKDYTVPMVQLDPKRTILVVCHSQNTFDKHRVIQNDSKYCSESSLTIKHFIKSPSLHKFYTQGMEIELAKYSAGSIDYKPEVVEEMKRREQEQNQAPMLQFTTKDGRTVKVHPEQLMRMLQQKGEECNELQKENQKLKELNSLLIESRRPV
jgi:glycosyltransferase involved in cell wall biosynthesis